MDHENTNQQQTEEGQTEERQTEEKKEGGPSFLVLYLLLSLSLTTDVLEIIETIGDLTIIIGIVLYVINLLLKSIFYLGIFTSGLLKEYLKQKNVALKIALWLATIASEYIPGLDALPLRTITLVLVILEVRPEFFVKYLKLLSFVSKFIPLPQAQAFSKIAGATAKVIEEGSATRIIHQALQSGSIPQLSSRLSLQSSQPSLSSQMRIKTPKAALIVVLLLLPSIIFAQDYYLKFLEPFFQQPSPLENVTKQLPKEIEKSLSQPEEIIYISTKIVPNGLLVGLEPIIMENDQLLTNKNFRYLITIPEISSKPFEAIRNIVFIRNFSLPRKITIQAELISLKSQKHYFAKKIVSLPQPKVVVASVDPEFSIITPLEPSARFLIALPYYFTSDNLNYEWFFDDQKVSNRPTIEKNEGVKRITVKVTNRYNPTEVAFYSFSP